MNGKIEPALTAEEWGGHGVSLEDGSDRPDDQHPPPLELQLEDGVLEINCDDGWYSIDVLPRQLPALIALANAALPDSDPRKVTRSKIEMARRTLAMAERYTMIEVATFDATDALLAALESYLPPE